MKKYKPVVDRDMSRNGAEDDRIARIDAAMAKATHLELPQDRLLVKIKDAAQLLSISERKIRDFVAEGTLETRGSNRLRRITMASIRRYVEEIGNEEQEDTK